MYTTIVGMTIVDCWKLFRTKKKSNISILDFADELGKDMLDTSKLFEFAEKGTCTRSGKQFHRQQEHDVKCVVTANASTDFSSLSMYAIAQKTHKRIHKERATTMYLVQQGKFN